MDETDVTFAKYKLAEAFPPAQVRTHGKATLAEDALHWPQCR